MKLGNKVDYTTAQHILAGLATEKTGRARFCPGYVNSQRSIKTDATVIRIILLIVSIISCNQISAQKQGSPPVTLSIQQTEAVFTDTIKRRLKLSYPIYRVYQYGDRSGLYYCVLTESRDTVGEKKDTMNHFIRAVTCKVGPMGLTKLWEINDQVISVPNEEDNIWFWTKYIEFKDHDNDGLIEPLIVYGSTAINGYDDGRINKQAYYLRNELFLRSIKTERIAESIV